MKPKSLRLVNYRSFADETITLPDGVTALVGVNADEPGSASNGSGKSTLLTAIHEALFDFAVPADQLRRKQTEMRIELFVEHAGETYRVRRHYRGRKNTLDFDQWDSDDGMRQRVLAAGPGETINSWVPLTRESKASTQQLLEQTLNVSETTWLASAYLAQGDAGAFCQAKPAQRRAIIGESLGENVTLWGRLLGVARADKATKQHELAGLQAREEQAERDAERRAEMLDARAAADLVVEQADAALRLAEERLAKSVEAADQARGQMLARATAERLLDERRRAYRDAQARVDDLWQEIDLLVDKTAPAIPQLEEQAAAIPSLEHQLAVAQAAEAEHRRLRDHQRSLLDERDRLTRQAEDAERAAGSYAERARGRKAERDRVAAGEDPACPTCGQHVADQARTRTLEALDAEIDRDEATSREQAETADHLRNQLNERIAVTLNDVATKIQVDLVDPRALERGLAASRDAANRLAAAKAHMEREPALQADHAAARAKLPELAAAGAKAREELQLLASASDLQAAVTAHANHETAVRNARGELDQARHAVARHQALLDDLTRRADEATTIHERAGQVRVDLAGIAACERAYSADGIPALLVESIAVPQVEQEATRILGELGTNWRVELRTQREKTDGTLREALDIVIVQPDGETTYEGLSGGEKSRANIAIRIALAQLLARQRGAELRVLAIDELEWLDETGLEHLAGVLRGLRGTFDQVVVVSHHPAMRDAFDQQLVVEKRDGASRLVAAC